MTDNAPGHDQRTMASTSQPSESSPRRWQPKGRNWLTRPRVLWVLAAIAAVLVIILFQQTKLKVGFAKFEVTWQQFAACPECADAPAEEWPMVCVAELDTESRAVRLGKLDAPSNLFCVRWRDAARLANLLTANLPATRVVPCYEMPEGSWRQPQSCRDDAFRLIGPDGNTIMSADTAIAAELRAPAPVNCAIKAPIPLLDGKRRVARGETYRGFIPAATPDEGAAVCLTGAEARRYADFLSSENGLTRCYEEGERPVARCNGYRLPTEEEWFLAAFGTDEAPRPRVWATADSIREHLCPEDEISCVVEGTGIGVPEADVTPDGLRGLVSGVHELAERHGGVGVVELRAMGSSWRDIQRRITLELTRGNASLRVDGSALELGASDTGLRLMLDPDAERGFWSRWWRWSRRKMRI